LKREQKKPAAEVRLVAWRSRKKRKDGGGGSNPCQLDQGCSEGITQGSSKKGLKKKSNISA